MNQDTIVNLILMGLVFVFMTLMIVGRVYVNHKYPSMTSFISSKRRNGISWKKAFKLWVILEIICFLATDDLSKHWYLALLCPTLIIYGLYAIYFADVYPNIEERLDIPEEEYQSYKKSFERDNKINKILK